MPKAELRDRVLNILLCVLDPAANGDDYPFASEDFDKLSVAALNKIGKWATVMMYEASDNPCRARHAPKELRDILPNDHYLQKWRMPKRGEVAA